MIDYAPQYRSNFSRTHWQRKCVSFIPSSVVRRLERSTAQDTWGAHVTSSLASSHWVDRHCMQLALFHASWEFLVFRPLCSSTPRSWKHYSPSSIGHCLHSTPSLFFQSLMKRTFEWYNNCQWVQVWSSTQTFAMSGRTQANGLSAPCGSLPQLTTFEDSTNALNNCSCNCYGDLKDLL